MGDKARARATMIENNIPVEYIYYRCILNTQVAITKFKKEDLLKSFGIEEYIDLFEVC